MRNAIIAGLLLISLGAASVYFYLSPRLALAEIREAAKANDTQTLAERVDFPKLREGVKAQASALLAGKVSRELGNGSPFAAFGAAMATVAVDAMIDAYVSPAAIGALASGLSVQHAAKKQRHQPAPPPAADSSQNTAATDQPKQKDSSVEFDALNQASAYVSGKQDKPVRFVLRLDGLRWRLVNIIFPPELFGE